MNMLIVAGLMFCGVNSAFSMGKQEREVLYTLNELGQDIAQVPMVVQNIDMFIGVLEMNIQITEAKLVAANKSFKKTLWQNAALFGACQLGSVVLPKVAAEMRYSLSYSLQTTSAFELSYAMFLNSIRGIAFVAGQLLVGLNVYDAYKTKNTLQQSLALDREILGQLYEIKGSVDQNNEPAENILLDSAE